MPPSLSLSPYTGTFGAAEASHLLRRTTFVHNKTLRDEAIGNGLANTIDQLLTVEDLPNKPLNYGVFDLLVPIGQTWVGIVYGDGAATYRRRSLQAWTVEQMIRPVINIREQMVLFWHNHFAISDIRDPHFLFVYSNTLRTHALGNFKQLVKDITIDPSMLRFLNGNSNSAASPNENYARELLELFTIGKGPLAGPEDYTNYTESDIKEIARVLTGWRDVGYRGNNLQAPGAIFRPGRHDREDKQLSHRFDNAVITNGGDQEYSQLIDILFLQDEIARFICRKLYRWFVFYEITDEIESEIIEPLAQTFINANYEIKPVLQQLLSSEHFFDAELRGCQIKNPFSFILPIVSGLGYNAPTTLESRYAFHSSIFLGAALLDMQYYEIPLVAGWKAYYQEPVYYRYWINNVTLGLRSNIIDLLVLTGLNANNQRIKPDFIAFISTLPNPSDPNSLIEQSANLLFTNGISTEQRDLFKEALIPGLPDFEWTLEYTNYLANPDDELLKLAITVRLTAMYQKMLNAPDFHLQ